jgi:hypothetical protein
VNRSAYRTKVRDPRDARILAAQARDVLEGAHREAEAGSERTAAILAQNAAVRASDAICTRDLARHSVGESHTEAIALLRQVRDEAGSPSGWPSFYETRLRSVTTSTASNRSD